MNAVKKILGVLWILIGLYAGYYLIINQAVPLWKSGGNDLVPAIIYSFILAPIITLGMSVFGLYAIQGEFSVKENE
jgi:fatty acid desaturase